MSLVELLVVVAITGITLATAMASVTGFLRHLARVAGMDAAHARVDTDLANLRQAWDGSIRDPFKAEPWLVIESEPVKESFELLRLALLLPDDQGESAYWEWSAPRYHRIRTTLPSGTFQAGGPSPGLVLWFPESPRRIYREGVAIDPVR